MKQLLITGALVGALFAANATATTNAPVDGPAVTTNDDVPPKPDEKKNQVTYWVLEATGSG